MGEALPIELTSVREDWRARKAALLEPLRAPGYSSRSIHGLLRLE